MTHVLQPQATFPRSASSRDVRSHATSHAAVHVSIAPSTLCAPEPTSTVCGPFGGVFGTSDRAHWR